MSERYSNVIPITWNNGDTVSDIANLTRGAFGTFIVPTGSAAVAKTLQFVATKNPQSRGQDFPDTDLLTTPKTLVAGANALNSDEISEVGAAQYVRFKLDTAVNADTVIYLLWKN